MGFWGDHVEEVEGGFPRHWNGNWVFYLVEKSAGMVFPVVGAFLNFVDMEGRGDICGRSCRFMSASFI